MTKNDWIRVGVRLIGVWLVAHFLIALPGILGAGKAVTGFGGGSSMALLTVGPWFFQGAIGILFVLKGDWLCTMLERFERNAEEREKEWKAREERKP